MPRQIEIQIQRGGETYKLSKTEVKILERLMLHSPATVPHKELVNLTERSFDTVKRAIERTLRPIITMEGGAIETIRNHGYRMYKIGPFK